MLAPDLRIVGMTVGNDVSARDIEGRNPLYLPQAKVYDACSALGPVITLAGTMPPDDALEIRLRIRRDADTAFEGGPSTARMARSFAELIAWLARQLVDEPDAVRVEHVERDDTTVLRLHVAADDVGKVIGRQGRIARALRTVARAGGARADRRVILEIAED